ncbi:prepilin peptidase CpaA [Paenibacillus sp. UNC496MF]|uniref:A24 family peptidase n=1 Tax=Paenibacillus sp. UNC496MF TaxID=1502753 RepID=UPI0008EB5171|nr:A24 family peptidase [Paenibacillus sp. UNC496MF]SFI99568.1 prepilin peptidase CpaA [Paenibacillus sp. UNC496MF]
MVSWATAILALLFVAAAFVCDIRKMTIPNRLNAVFFAAGAVYHVAAGGWNGGLQALLGAAAGLVPLLLLYALKGIGAGDVKFFAALGAVVGPAAVLQVLMYAILYGGLLGLAFLLLKRTFARRLLGVAVSVIAADSRLAAWETNIAGSGGLRFPFMIAVLPGAVTAWCMAPF